MTTVLVTGSHGFIGKNLVEALRRRGSVRILELDVDSSEGDLFRGLDEADIIFHLAGVNRPKQEREFADVNTRMTELVVERLARRRVAPLLVLSSSIQAVSDNPYGISKRRAEECVERYYGDVNGRAVIYRLPNVFGKWCRPNYNSVVATFCHQIARDLPIEINNPERVLDLVYIDDVVDDMMCIAFDEPRLSDTTRRDVSPVYQITVQGLADAIYAFRSMRTSLVVPDMSDAFIRKLYATYMSHHGEHEVAYGLAVKCDARGELAELIKAPTVGQIFISRTKPGVVRGNHYHNTKVEKFCVVQGDARIRFRNIADDHTFSVSVSGDEFRVVDIPPGYTHSIENVSDAEMVVLFWANEIFDQQLPDTFYREA